MSFGALKKIQELTTAERSGQFA